MNINAGSLDRTVVLLAPAAAAPSGNGDARTTYAVAGSRRCARLQLKSSAAEGESQRAAAADVELLLRRDTLTRTVTAAWRAVFGGATFAVAGVDATPRDGSLVLSLKGDVA